MTSSPPLLVVDKISKAFPGVRALQDVSLTVAKGECVAVIGENGAGKSTLMKILAGVQRPDSGEIRVQGTPVRIDSVARGLELGISLIHQELNLADNLSIGANVFLGREPRRWGVIRQREIERLSQPFLEAVGLDVSPRHIVGRMTIGRQQLVEIAKALSVQARLLIMDEPTSSLSTRETECLFAVIDDLKKRGVSIVYISHRLGEVKRLADRVVVLRDGENAGELAREQIDHDAMVRLMVGRDISKFYSRTQHALGDPVLEVRNLVTAAWPRHRLSFSLRAGEIVGVAGLVGSGRTEMIQALFGMEQRLGGDVLLEGSVLSTNDTPSIIGQGVALVPEDRKQHGLVLDMNVSQNISLAGLRRNARMGFLLNQSVEAGDTQRMTSDLSIKTPSSRQVVRYLSGGNQQKVVLGKWLALSPRVLLLDEPTRGIDVGAKQEIYALIEALAQQGMAIMFVSSEMEEILGLSDRVLVMHEGRMTGELMRDKLSEEAVMQLATLDT